MPSTSVLGIMPTDNKVLALGLGLLSYIANAKMDRNNTANSHLTGLTAEHAVFVKGIGVVTNRETIGIVTTSASLVHRASVVSFVPYPVGATPRESLPRSF